MAIINQAYATLTKNASRQKKRNLDYENSWVIDLDSENFEWSTWMPTTMERITLTLKINERSEERSTWTPKTMTRLTSRLRLILLWILGKMYLTFWTFKWTKLKNKNIQLFLRGIPLYGENIVLHQTKVWFFTILPGVTTLNYYSPKTSQKRAKGCDYFEIKNHVKLLFFYSSNYRQGENLRSIAKNYPPLYRDQKYRKK